MPSVSRPEIAVGAVVLRHGHLLLVQRGRPPAQGLWTIPGGRVEPGETMNDALEREVQEECGLEVNTEAFLGWVERIGADYHFVIMDFRASVVTAAEAGDADLPALVAGDDAADARWVGLAEVGDYGLVDGLLEFLAEHGIL